MNENFTLSVIARIHCDFSTKFGIPRQSGLVEGLKATIVFEPEYRDANALRGMEGYSHLWLIWGFSSLKERKWSPMVKPPRLGGNTRMGVFATRSPNRPNPLGLSSVKLEGTEQVQGLGTVLHISGADLMDGTPIYDIKPYLSYTDSHPDARNGFGGEKLAYELQVECDEALLARIPQSKHVALLETLKQDPRPAYHADPDTPYGFAFAGMDVRFRVSDGVLRVFAITPLDELTDRLK